jgi:hypothetical protein
VLGERTGRKLEITHYEEFPNASRAAQSFAENYRQKRATGTVTEIITVDTKKKFYQVVLEWDADGRKKGEGQWPDIGRGPRRGRQAGGRKRTEADEGRVRELRSRGADGGAPKPARRKKDAATTVR